MVSKDDRAIVGTTMTDVTIVALIGHSAAGKSECLKQLKLGRHAADMDVMVSVCVTRCQDMARLRHLS